jgi:Molybdenum cofactor biosynthesis enzyme
MPEGIVLSPARELLTFEEIELVSQAAAELGIRRFKITGGEPLVRRGCPKLIGRLRRIPKVEQVTLTTNGVLLGDFLDELLENGLDGVNISLDTLNADLYQQITGFDELERVREGIYKAVESGLRVKINTVLQRGVNDSEWEALTGFAREIPVDVRFIELMPIGFGEKEKGVNGNEILSLLRKKYPQMEKDDRIHGNGPAVYYRIPGFEGCVGFICAVHRKFCASCNRIRLTAKGELKPCLCYGDCVDLRRVVREGAYQEIKGAIWEAVIRKPKMHCFETEEGVTECRRMVEIGG